MTDPLDIEPILDDWFADGYDVLPDRSVDAVLRTVRKTTQRGAWRAPWRIPHMLNVPRLIAAGAALVAVLAVGSIAFFGMARNAPVGGLTASPSPRPTPIATPTTAPSSTISQYETPLGVAIVGLDGTVRQDLGLPADAWAPDLTADGRDIVYLTRSKDVIPCYGCGSGGPTPVFAPVGRALGSYLCCDTTGFAQAAWSPDGTQLAYQVADRAGNLDIYVVPVDRTQEPDIWTAGPTRLTSDPAVDGWPAWSPDGKTIYYTNDGATPADSSGFSDTQEVWQIPAAGGTPKRLTNNSVPDLQPDVAADGTVVFWEGGEIWTMAADGTQQHRLAAIPSNIGFNPRWSPDGSKIAVLQYDASRRALFDPAIRRPSDLPLLQVVVVDVATGDATTVGPRVASFFNPVSWTPDGTALLIDRFDDGS